MAVDLIRKELILSFSLLFGRSVKSLEIARNQLGRNLANGVQEWNFNRDGRADLRHFEYYRPHLAFIQQQMLLWKPRKFSELLIPGYGDRLIWFTAVFGLIFGVIGALSLITSIVQMVIAIIALKAQLAQ